VTRRAIAGIAAAALAAATTTAAVLSAATGAGPATAAPPTSAASTPAPRPTTPVRVRVVLDPSPAADVLAGWRRGERDPRAMRDVAAHIGYRTLRDQLADQAGCDVSDRELCRALANPDSGACGFGLHPAWQQRATLDSLARAIRADRRGLAERVVERASPYVPVIESAQGWAVGGGAAAGGAMAPGARAAGGGSMRAPVEVRVAFVLASQFTFDAITVDRDADGVDKPLVIVNLTDVLQYGPDTASRLAALEHVLAHEAFHAALHDAQERSPGWREFVRRPSTALVHIAQVMTDEGAAHYVDWRDRPGADTLFTANPGARERQAFDQLALAVRRLKESPTGSAEWEEILQLASTGPLWSKYGAITGMFAASRIERALGREALVRAVGAGPPEFLRVYADLAARDSTWKALPAELVDLE
jgi:hypothetical protein